MLSVTSKRKILFFNVITLVTAFSPFIGEGNINYLLIGVMILTITITSVYLLKPNKKNLIFFIFPITMLVTGIINIDYFRASSYLYGLLFILFFGSNHYLMRYSRITIKQFQNLLKIIIYSYFIVLIIQQVMFIIGFENLFNEISNEEWKFNSLHTEPSYAAMVIILLFHSYIYLRKIQNNSLYRLSDLRKDKHLWIAFTFIMLTTGSSFGVLLFVLFIISFIQGSKNFFIIFLLLFVLYLCALSYEFRPLVRLDVVIQSLILNPMDYYSLIEIDHSSAVRLIPFLIGLSTIEFYKFFGMGMDFSANYFPTIIEGIDEGAFGGGLFPAFVFDNGLINTILLIFLIKKKVIHKFFSFEFLLFLIVLFNTSFNSQLFWSVMTILSINISIKTSKLSLA